MDNKEEKEERYQVTVTQKDIRDIKQEVGTLSGKIDEVHSALIGSPLAKDGGMVQRLLDCENGIEEVKEDLVLVEKTMQEKIEEAKLANMKSELYIKIIWGLGGTICAGVFAFIVHLIFNK